MSLDENIVRCSKMYGVKSYSCRLTAFYASKSLAISLHLIFPPVYGFANAYSKFPGYFENGLPYNNKPGLVTIVWKTASNIVQTNGMYHFNHFCPFCVFMVRDKFCSIPVSHLNKVRMLKDHVFNPFKNTNHSYSFIELERQTNLPSVSNNNVNSSILIHNKTENIYYSQNFCSFVNWPSASNNNVNSSIVINNIIENTYDSEHFCSDLGKDNDIIDYNDNI